MPKLPRAIGNLIGWAKEVNQALQQLADRAFDVPNPQPSKPETPLPFQVKATPTLLNAAPGIIGSTSISGSVLTESSPADGDWLLIGKVTINSTTGEITNEEVYWSSTSPTNTSTEFHIQIASVTVSSPDPPEILQFNYGPIYVIVGGGATDIWVANLL